MTHLEGITDGVADHGGLVDLGALAAQRGVHVALDVLLAVVPGAAGVAHRHRELHWRA
jgi:hypothetical protein